MPVFSFFVFERVESLLFLVIFQRIEEVLGGSRHLGRGIVSECLEENTQTTKSSEGYFNHRKIKIELSLLIVHSNSQDFIKITF